MHKNNKSHVSLVNDIQYIPSLQTNKTSVLQKLISDLDINI